MLEALGRGVVVEPFLPTMLAAIPLAAAGNTDLIEAAMEGTALLACAHVEPNAYYTGSHVEVAATQSGDSWAVSGRKSVVINGATADRDGGRSPRPTTMCPPRIGRWESPTQSPKVSIIGTLNLDSGISCCKELGWKPPKEGALEVVVK